MSALLVFSVALLAIVLTSGLTRRTVFAPAALVLLAALIIGGDSFRSLVLPPAHSLVKEAAGLAMFSVLFVDGMHVNLRGLGDDWRRSMRALVLGLPLTWLLISLVARWVLGFAWVESLLVGAILSPTDPVFASSLVQSERIPKRLQRLLSVESGMNDWLAFPVVLILLHIASQERPHWASATLEVLGGLVLGVVLPALILLAQKAVGLRIAPRYAPLHGFALGVVLLAVSHVTGANEFLAAFTGGVTVGTVKPSVSADFKELGESLTEVLKLGGVFVFGLALSLHSLLTAGGPSFAFAALVLLAVRPLAVGGALLGTGLSHREWITAAWFGPRGFASIYYGFLVLNSALQSGKQIFDAAALVIVLSILVHSSIDVLFERWFGNSDASG